MSKARKQFPLFWKALTLFNKTNQERVYVVNGKPVTFVYSFGGLDMEYQAYDGKELLRFHLELKKKESVLKERNAFWIVICSISILLVASLWLGNWVWLLVLLALPLGLIIDNLRKRQISKKEISAKLEFENEIAELRNNLLRTQEGEPDQVVS